MRSDGIEIKICPQIVAEQMPGDIQSAIISITDPGCPEAELEPGWAYMLRLKFHDIDCYYPGFSKMSWCQAFRIATFLHQMNKKDIRQLVVHCRAGSSRSAAIALAASHLMQSKVVGDWSGYNRLILFRCMTAAMLLLPMQLFPSRRRP